MLSKSKMVGSLAGLGFLLALTPNVELAGTTVRPWQGAMGSFIPQTQGNGQNSQTFRPLRKTDQDTHTKTKMPVSATKQTSQFQKIEQPIRIKLAVALVGLGLISAELWWFVFSKRSFKNVSLKR